MCIKIWCFQAIARRITLFNLLVRAGVRLITIVKNVQWMWSNPGCDSLHASLFAFSGSTINSRLHQNLHARRWSVEWKWRTTRIKGHRTHNAEFASLDVVCSCEFCCFSKNSIFSNLAHSTIFHCVAKFAYYAPLLWRNHDYHYKITIIITMVSRKLLLPQVLLFLSQLLGIGMIL